MQTATILKTSFFIGIVLTLVGAWLKIIRNEGADTWLVLALITSFLFVVTAIYEVSTSKKIDKSEKAIWIVALIFFNGIAGLTYIPVGRKRIVAAR